MSLVDQNALAERFEQSRARLRAVAYRMLGSLAEADDAVQEAWLRLGRSDAAGIDNLEGWLTTVVARVCLDMLRARKARAGQPAIDSGAAGATTHVPDPVVAPDREAGAGAADPEQEALIADSIGLALLVVLETLPPPERVAFVLHDMFATPFEEIAPIVGRSVEATRQLASRARRRVQGASPAGVAGVASDTSDARRDRERNREIVRAFMAASRGGDFDALVAVLDPDVVLRSDGGAAAPERTRTVRGAKSVATGALIASRLAGTAKLALVNGAPGIVSFDAAGRPFAVMGFSFRAGKIAEIDILGDTARLARLDLGAV
jgi:RNA polymerase sigma factor (sigma-70 family)